jgi:hypothetical protein
VIGGRYQLRAAIGKGGMGTVWQATDTLLRRDVAVKEVLLPPGMSRTERDAMCERTLREARACAALSHPSVVQVFDVVTEADRPWIVMELLHARSLADIIVSDGPLAPRAVAKIGIALLGALEVAHAAGVLHRDVKPANVLICSDGRCVLTDFGVARVATESNLTTPGMVLGSPHFISPERAIGSAFGPPSDLFSLGVTLFTAVEGQPPFDKGDPFETMRAVVEEAPTAPVRAGALRGVLYALLEKDPARRADIATARNALRELLAGPLATSQPVHQATDPYAVMRSAQPPAWAPPPPPPPPPPQPAASGMIGGRAMLAPGELPGDRVGRHAQGADAPGPDPAAAHAALTQPTGAAGPGGYPGLPPAQRAGEYHPGYQQAQPGGGTAAWPGAQHGYPPGYAPGAAPVGAGMPGSPAAPGAGFPGPAAGRPPAAGALAGVRKGVAAMPGWMKAVVAGGAIVLVVVTTLLLSRNNDAGPKIGTDAAPTAAAPAFPVKRFATNGAAVNVPQDWKKQPAKGTYVDFRDPQDEARWVRVDTYRADGTGNALLNGFDKRGRAGNICPGYELVGRPEVTLSGQAGSELEYRCHPDSGDRHGIVAAVIIDSRAFVLTMSVPEERFDESRPVFDEMVRSFTVGN